jgi:hypothetical protein
MISDKENTMNTKKKTALFASLMSAILFTACTSPSNKVKFSENWYNDTTTSTVTANVKETLTYSVGFTALSNSDTQYRSLRYNQGTYTTELVSVYSEELQTYVYRYSTDLSISGEHECKTTGEIFNFTDSVTSEVVFTSAMQGLKPISSKKTLLSHTPSTSTAPQTLAECYKKWNYTIETTYDENLNGTSVQTIYNEAKDENTPAPEPSVTTTKFTAKDDSYTTLDNEQLLFAIRGITTFSSQKFNVYNNAWKRSQLVALNTQSETSDEFSLKINGEDKKATIAYTPITLRIQEKNSGSDQTVWVAKTTERTNNLYRNVVLSFSIPVYNAYGTFDYKLVEANFI